MVCLKLLGKKRRKRKKEGRISNPLPTQDDRLQLLLTHHPSSRPSSARSNQGGEGEECEDGGLSSFLGLKEELLPVDLIPRRKGEEHLGKGGNPYSHFYHDLR